MTEGISAMTASSKAGGGISSEYLAYRTQATEKTK